MWRQDKRETTRRTVMPALWSCWLTVLQYAQLGTDLAQRPALGIQVPCTLNIHGATGNEPQPGSAFHRIGMRV